MRKLAADVYRDLKADATSGAGLSPEQELEMADLCGDIMETMKDIASVRDELWLNEVRKTAPDGPN